MKTIVKIICFILGCLIIGIITISSNSKWFENFSTSIPSPYRNGDLFLFSNMPGYRTPVKRIKIHVGDKPRQNTSLTLIGDSYVRNFDSASFHADDYRFVHWDRVPDTIPAPDPSKTNILIIETTERYCRWRLKKEKLLYAGQKQKQKANAGEIKLSAEDNLQYLVTNLDWALPFKELKTFIYLRCFDKFDDRVAKPDGSGRLYLEETIDPGKNSSSFNAVTDQEIDDLVRSINHLYSEARQSGFNHVYLSIIPNAASIYRPSELPYNRLIERIQENPELKMPCIDAYSLLKKQKESVFYKNDTHWNEYGELLWLARVNGVLKNR